MKTNNTHKNIEEIVEELEESLGSVCAVSCGHAKNKGFHSPLCKRDFLTKTLTTLIEERDKYWQDQEMGKPDDCHKHCEDAVKEEREKFEAIFDADSCECDNCFRRRRYFKTLPTKDEAFKQVGKQFGNAIKELGK